MKRDLYLFILIIIMSLIFLYHIRIDILILYNIIIKGFYSSPTQIGNTLCSYFDMYALSVCNKKDFTCKTDDYSIIKY